MMSSPVMNQKEKCEGFILILNLKYKFLHKLWTVSWKDTCCPPIDDMDDIDVEADTSNKWYLLILRVF